MQKGKLTRASFPPQWNDVVRDVLALFQDGKLAGARFPWRLNDVIGDGLVLLQ